MLVGLFALQTCGWLFFDVGELGAAGSWDLWIGGTDASGADAIPATTATDPALLVLQIGAVFAAFTASRAAGGLLAADGVSTRPLLQRIVAEEAVQCVDDLVLRRTNWGMTEADVDSVRKRVAQIVNLESR